MPCVTPVSLVQLRAAFHSACTHDRENLRKDIGRKAPRLHRAWRAFVFGNARPQLSRGATRSLGRRFHALAPGLTPRSAIEKFAAIQMIDLRIPTTDGREIVLSRYTECARHKRHRAKVSAQSGRPPRRLWTTEIPIASTAGVQKRASRCTPIANRRRAAA